MDIEDHWTPHVIDYVDEELRSRLIKPNEIIITDEKKTTLEEYLKKRDKLLNQKKRECCVCPTPLNFLNFISQSINHEFYRLEQLIKIWNSSYIQLYCCNCAEIERQKNHQS